MLVMIILVSLSIVFLIGAIIYSSNKNKKYNKQLEKQGLSKENKKSKTKFVSKIN